MLPLTSIFPDEHHARIQEAVSEGVQRKVSSGAKISNRYNQVPHLTQDTNSDIFSLIALLMRCKDLPNTVRSVSSSARQQNAI